MRVLYLVLVATVADLVHSPASAFLTTTAADTKQTVTSLLAPGLVGGQNKDLNMRSLRTHPMEDDNVEDSHNDEERGISDMASWLKYKAGKMNPKQLYKYLGLEGLGEKAREHPNFLKYLKKSAQWRNNQ
ncbi:hypothetical protein PC129_g23014 [Phytophthora cactorum]|uniref:RxLR effector protein n=1 Tax=Phytophthora cactorum TaxID=29920 RepID=A0A8T1JI26_9STRA|nr:hypothetical protein GQ600_2707 [Phytophthora cactorum]KAF1781259.1 hypothetical protein GQ600_2708 [Phytophthora cactorum]KAF1781277.1 hypothetical protein GQ600_2726 [Phytophthora cactorum]KAF1781278.1 hypothetical protein GQ600_2727 [Phytophthora cactorum]KAG2775346.1 hypothetical protein Pcac1_g13874 [Phytophthora cactorum]